MTSPQRNRKVVGFPPIQTEALGLLINPTPVDSSPPLSGKPRATTIKSNSVSMQSPQQTQNINQQYGAAPPSPTHTASPPSAPSGFLPGAGQNAPPSQGSGFLRPQQRVPAPILPNTVSRLTDSWGPEEQHLGDTSSLIRMDDERMLDQRPRPGSGPHAELSRTSPISVNSARSAASMDPRNRNTRPHPTHSTSSPPLSTTLRSQQMPSPTQQLPLGPNIPHPTSLAGFIPPAPPGPTIPLLNRSMTDTTITSARPLLTPPSSDHMGMGRRNNTTSPHRNQSPPYRAPFDSSADLLTSKSGPKDYSQHFQYDNDDQQSQYEESQGEITDREPSPSVATTHLAQSHPVRMPERRFPVQEEVEPDDDVTPSGLLHHQQQPPRWPVNQPQQSGPVKQQSRGPSPPPASPSPQAPIPLIAPQSYPAAHPPILDHRDESPPRAPSAGTLNAQRYNAQNFEHDEPAEASSDHHTPKSPTGPLPADYSHSYAQYNNPRFRRGPTQEQLAYQHALFAYQMGGMPAPRGPTHIPRTEQNFASLGGVAAAITSEVTGNGYNGANMYDHWDGMDYNDTQSPVSPQRGFGYGNRPDAPIPPTPHSMSNVASPPTYPQPSYGMMDPPAHMIPERYIPSALSSYLSSPIMHNPFLPRFPPPQSLVSSPSHIPLELTPAPALGKKLGRKKSKKSLRASKLSKQIGAAKVPPVPTRTNTTTTTATNALEPPRIGAESTVPKESSSEESDTDDTKKMSGSVKKVYDEDEEEEEDVWVNESSEDELDVEYHSRYIENPSKRKRKWEQKWDAMLRLFQEIDRTTDSPMLLLAAPSTASSPKTHIVVSRSIQRDPGKYMPHAQTARTAFSQIAKSRRQEKADQAAAEKAKRTASFEQQLAQAANMGRGFGDMNGSAGTGSPGGFSHILGGLSELQNLPQLASSGEEGMQQALTVALESLKQMHMIYEQREERRREEAERQRQESAGLDYLWRAFNIDGTKVGASSPTGSGSGKKSP